MFDAHDIMEESENITINVTPEQHEAIRNMFHEKGWQLELVNSEDGDTYHSYKPGYVIENSTVGEECPHCYCTPCVTDNANRQQWWVQVARQPNRMNAKLRKQAYRRFWTMLYHRLAWLDARYLAKKTTALQQQHRHEGWVGTHVRDIMPDCVLTRVRQWYPNPEKIPYMGHLWG